MLTTALPMAKHMKISCVKSKPLGLYVFTNSMAASTPVAARSEMKVNIGDGPPAPGESVRSVCAQSQTSCESGRNFPHISHVCI
jgi:hypothetical protein